MTIASQLLEQGREEGISEGIRKGREEGREQGRRETLLREVRRFQEILGMECGAHGQSEISLLAAEQLEARAAELAAEIARRLK
jgi:flagellar biosynthesis/type III secretory pathway protein FliH